MVSGQATARNAHITIEDNGATARNIGGDVNTSTMTFSAEAPETTAYGDTYRTRVPDGIKDWTLEVSGWYNDTATTGIETVLFGVLGAQTVIVWGPAGSTSTYTSYTGSCIVQEYSIEAPVDNVVTFSYTAVGSSGSITRGNF